MGNVNEGHERDEVLSTSSDSADDLSESLSSFSFDEREDDDRSGVGLVKETDDISVLSGTLDVNDGLDEIVAESTRVEQAIEFDLSPDCQIGGDATTMVQEQGMTSLISNVSLPISESIIPSSFDILGESSPFEEGDEVFHTPDLSAESKAETSAAVASQFQALQGLNDSLSPLYKSVGDESVSVDQSRLAGTEESIIDSCTDAILPDTSSVGRTGERESDQQQVDEANLDMSHPHPDNERSAEQSGEIPPALSILDSILGNQEPLPSDGDGFSEVQTSLAIADAADEIIAKVENADFVLTSTKVLDSSLSVRIAECDKCGHILHDAGKGKAELELPEQWPIKDKIDGQVPEEALFLSTVETVVGSVIGQLTNDITSKQVRHTDEARKSDRPLECPVSFSDATGKVDGNLTKKDTPLAAPCGNSATKPEGPTQSGESCQREPEFKQLTPAANLTPCQESTNSLSVREEFDTPSQDIDRHPQADIVQVAGTKDSEFVYSGFDASVEDSPAVLTSTSPASKAACKNTAVGFTPDKNIEVPPEKTAALSLSSVVSESLRTENNEYNVDKIAMKELSDLLSLSPGVTPAILTKSQTVNESAAKEDACPPARKDEQRIKAPELPRHTPERPNWAIAPVEPASASKPPVKNERQKPAARRGRKSGEVASKDGPPRSSTSNANRSPATTSTVTLQSPEKSPDIKASISKSPVRKDSEAKILEAKAPAPKSADMKVPDAKKAPKPILRLPDIGTYEKPEMKPVKAKPAVSFEAVPLFTAKTTTYEQSAPSKQATSTTGVDYVCGSRSEVIPTALPSTSQASASSNSTSNVEPTPGRRGRSMSISAAQNNALPPNKRPASIVSSWRSGTALPVIPEGTMRSKQPEDGRKSLSATQSSIATVDVSAKDKIAAILAEHCQSNLFKSEVPTAQGNVIGAASSAPRPAAIAIAKVHASSKRGEARSPESPLAEGFQANEHPLFAWRHGVTQPSPPTVVHTSAGATAAVRKPKDKDCVKDGAVSVSKGKTKAAKTKLKAKAPQAPQGPATVNVGDDDLSLHARQRGEPVKVNLPQRATPPEPLRYQTPPKTARPAFFSDVGGPASITPSPASTHQHSAAFQRLVAGFPAYPSNPEQAANRDVHPQMFMPQRSEGISMQVQHSIRDEQPPQLRRYEFVPRNHTTSHPIGHSHVPASLIPIRSVDSGTEHPGQRPIQAPPTSYQAFAANPSVARQADNPFLESMSDFDGRAQSRDFSLYQQQLYHQRQAEIMRQSQGLRHSVPESPFAQSQVNIDQPFSETWNGRLRSRPGAHQDVPIYQTSRLSVPPTNFTARGHGAPLAGQQHKATAFGLPTNQFPPYNQRE